MKITPAQGNATLIDDAADFRFNDLPTDPRQSLHANLSLHDLEHFSLLLQKLLKEPLAYSTLLSDNVFTIIVLMAVRLQSSGEIILQTDPSVTSICVCHVTFGVKIFLSRLG